MFAVRFPLFFLVAALVLPSAIRAEENNADAEQSSCKFPTEVLWHSEEEDNNYRLGVSVLNENEQQMPGLKARNFKVFVDDQEVARASDSFKVEQSKNVFSEASTAGDSSTAANSGDASSAKGTGEGEVSRGLGVDPVHYDLYLSIDLTESMADKIAIKGQKKELPKISFVASRLHTLFTKETLFDSNDRVYLSGFTSKLETSFMTETTADRKALGNGLRGMLRFVPQGTDAALYYAMDFNMKTIRDRAEFYTGNSERRQAVLIVITDSFNGMNMTASRRVSRCRDNEALSESVREAVKATNEATGGNFKLYMLGIGETGETKRYTHEGKLSSRCNIRGTQQEVVDKRSFRAITADLQKGKGGFVGHPDPIRLLRVVQSQFESLRKAYEISYSPPEGVSRPKKFRVSVEIGEETCSHEITETAGFIRKAKAQGATKPEEVALLLAALIFMFFFIPRSLANVSTVLADAGSSGSAAPKKKGKKKRAKKRK
jgi:hypothetical protein